MTETTETLMEQQRKIQLEIIQQGQRYECRKLALESAKNLDNANISKYLLENADEIYNWLIKEL